MIEATRRWFRRNRTRFAIGAGAVGLVYLAGQYAWSKWLEARQVMAEERLSKENLRRRFEQNQEDCTYTVLALLPTVRDEIIGSMPVEDISSELQKQKAERLARGAGGTSDAASSEFPSAPASTIDDDRGSLSSLQTGSYIHASQMPDSSSDIRQKRSKAQLWYDMKIQSITRSLTLLYTLSLLTLLTRIQLNLLGRRTYLSSVVSMASPPSGRQASVISLENNDDDNYDNAYGNDFETNRRYLTFSWWLLHRGCKEIAENVHIAVKEVFGSINPREDITLERLSGLILEVRKRMEGASEVERREHRWLSCLLPPRDQETVVLRENTSAAESPDTGSEATSSPSHLEVDQSLRKLLDETSDLVDSPTFTHVLTLILNACFSHLIDERIATEAFKVKTADPAARVIEITGSKCKVAQTLAVFCRQAHVIAAGSGEVDELSAVGGTITNEYLATIDQVKDLEAFAAVIYSSNFDFEAPQKEEQIAEQLKATSLAAEEKAENEHDAEVVDEAQRDVDEAIEEMEGAADPSSQEPKDEEVAEQRPQKQPLESAWARALQREDGIK